MIRVQVDPQSVDLEESLNTVALALARFLISHCPDPNPARSHTAARKGIRPAPDTGTTALIADQDYSIKQAMGITGKPEITLRKNIASGRLVSRLEKGRRIILGKDLAEYMSKVTTDESEASSDEA